MKKFNIDYVLISLVVATLLCIWVFCSIQLKVIPLIPTSLSEDLCNGWNTVLVNLAYSFTAGLFFFLLTVVLKDHLEKRKLKKVFKTKMRFIASPIESIIDVFYGEVNANVDRTREGITAVLSKRNFNDKVAMAEELGHQITSSGTYCNYLSSKCGVSKERALEMIKLYCSFLTADEIIKLEEFASMPIMSTSAIASGLNAIDSEDSKIKKSLIKQFCDLYDKLEDLRRTF